MDTFTGTAYAKLNLFLNVIGRREDGYHTLETVFQEISFGDNLSLTRHRRGGISVRSNIPFIPNDERNLAYRAAQVFFEESGIKNQGLYINIRKNIPVGAGMAGGSADAATVLDILNGMYGRPFSRYRLKKVALRLGADVPFCLEGGIALAKGVGEELYSLPEMPSCWLVICRPPFAISTKNAFELLDEMKVPQLPQSVEPMLSALKNKQLEHLCQHLYNSFEEPIFRRYPQVAQIKEEILSLGAMGALMTGSGAAVFGVFKQNEQAKKAKECLSLQYRDVFLAHPM